MPFTLSKAQREEWATRRRHVADNRAAVEAEFATLSAALARIAVGVNEAIGRYNEVVRKAEAFARSVAEEHRETYDERSERWQESDAGQAALSFVEAWEEIDLDVVEPVSIVMPDAPNFGASRVVYAASRSRLDDVPEEAE